MLLETNGVSILLDGVCGHISPYFATDDIMLQYITDNPPNVLAFTHRHIDHFDMKFAKYYEDNNFGQVLLPEYPCDIDMSGVNICSVSTRHIGKNDTLHCSYIIHSDEKVWFMGDASPLSLKDFDCFSKPDLIIVPFAYALSDFSWKKTKSVGAKKIVMVHMPEKSKDEFGIWDTVLKVTNSDDCLVIPDLREQLNFELI